MFSPSRDRRSGSAPGRPRAAAATGPARRRRGSTRAVKTAPVAASSDSSSSSRVSRSSSASTRGASTGKSTCASAPSSSTTATTTSSCGSDGSAKAASSKLSGRMPEHHGPGRTGVAGASSGDPVAGERDAPSSTLRLDEVHRGRADERGDEEVLRPAVERLRRVDLLDASVAHHRDALAERHRLDLVVGHVDGRRAEALRAGSRARRASPTRSFASRFESGSSIRNAFGSRTIARPIATRWRWPPDSCAGRRSRSSSRPSTRATSSTRRRGLGLRRLPHLEAVAEVLRARSCAGRARSSGRPSRCRGRAATASVTSRPPIRIVPAVASSRPGDQPQQRRLAAAGRADEHDELSVVDLQTDIVDRRDPPPNSFVTRSSDDLSPTATSSFSGDEDRLHLQAVVEDDESAAPPARRTPETSSRQARGNRRRGRHGIVERRRRVRGASGLPSSIVVTLPARTPSPARRATPSRPRPRSRRGGSRRRQRRSRRSRRSPAPFAPRRPSRRRAQSRPPDGGRRGSAGRRRRRAQAPRRRDPGRGGRTDASR